MAIKERLKSKKAIAAGVMLIGFIFWLVTGAELPAGILDFISDGAEDLLQLPAGSAVAEGAA